MNKRSQGGWPLGDDEADEATAAGMDGKVEGVWFKALGFSIVTASRTCTNEKEELSPPFYT